MTINTDLLTELVDEFLEPFNCESEYDSDFYYDPSDRTVFFSIVVSERADRLFKEYVKKTFNFDASSIFMLSLLHEVGHAYTFNKFSKTALKVDKDAKNIISEALEMCDSDEIFSLYFDLDVEKVATAWAVEYYKANTKRCEDFYSKFLDELHKQYAEIGLTE